MVKGEGMDNQYLTEEMLTVYEAAQALGKTEAAVRALIQTGSLGSVKVKTIRLVPRRAIERYRQRAGL
jgi:excisionase family DNA binding protein